MDGNLLAKRIVCIAVRERATNSRLVKAKRFYFSRNFIDLAFAVQYVPIGTGAVGSVSSQPGSGTTFE